MANNARNMKHWRLGILLGCITLLTAALLGLNFRIAYSNIKSEKNITTTSIGDGLPYAMQRRENINLALIGEGPMITALQKALSVEMKDAGITDFEWVQQIEPKYESPVLIINVGKPGLLWTPFFATSQFPIQAGYSSSGYTTLMGDTPINLDNKNGPALQMHSDYKIRDRSWGLISRLGYHQILADYLAQQIIASLKDLYKVST